MTDLTALFAVAAVLAAALATISIWAPRRLPVKVGAVVLACAFLPAAYAAMVDLLSKPKPASFEWWLDKAGEATVLGSSMVEDEAIYLWLQLDGVGEPRAYALPWDQRTAEQLQAAAREAAEQQAAVRMRLPFEPTLDDREPRFYALPQPALPPKDAPSPPARSTAARDQMPDRRAQILQRADEGSPFCRGRAPARRAGCSDGLPGRPARPRSQPSRRDSGGQDRCPRGTAARFSRRRA